MPVDINRGTTNVPLPKQISGEIWSNVLEASTIMQVSQTLPLPGAGLTIPMITGEPVAAWVNETDEKPVSRGTVGSKSMKGYTIAVIVPFSNQFKRDLGSLYGALVQRLPAALAKRFDETVYGVTAVPGSDFDTLGGVPQISFGATTPTLAQVLSVATAIAAAGGDLTHWIVSNPLYASLLGAVNPSSGLQYFTQGQQPDGTLASSIFGAPVSKTKAAMKKSTTIGDDLGFAGDFSGAYVGTVEGVSVAISDQATINDGGTQINLWQRDMFAVRAEIELGFIVRDLTQYVRLTDGVVDTP
jgi:HK97 family phage major capsid protein